MTSKRKPTKKAGKTPKAPVEPKPEPGKEDVPAKATPDTTPDAGSAGDAVKESAPAGAIPEEEKDAATATATDASGRDSRLPAPGTKLTRTHEGTVIEVEVLEDGFMFNGTRHKSLSGIAKTLTGTSTNGFVYFGLSSSGRSRGTRLATKIRRIEALIGKLRLALQDGQEALAEAEAEHEALTAQPKNQPEA